MYFPEHSITLHQLRWAVGSASCYRYFDFFLFRFLCLNRSSNSKSTLVFTIYLLVIRDVTYCRACTSVHLPVRRSYVHSVSVWWYQIIYFLHLESSLVRPRMDQHMKRWLATLQKPWLMVVYLQAPAWWTPNVHSFLFKSLFFQIDFEKFFYTPTIICEVLANAKLHPIAFIFLQWAILQE